MQPLIQQAMQGFNPSYSDYGLKSKEKEKERIKLSQVRRAQTKATPSTATVAKFSKDYSKKEKKVEALAPNLAKHGPQPHTSKTTPKPLDRVHCTHATTMTPVATTPVGHKKQLLPREGIQSSNPRDGSRSLHPEAKDTIAAP